MRFLVVLTLVFVVSSVGVSHAQHPTPRALYNPATGAIYFDRLDAIVEADDGLLILQTLEGNLLLNAVALDLPIPGPVLPQTTDTLFYWQLHSPIDGPFDGPFDEPVFAGNIVAPGTDYTNLYFQSFRQGISLGFGNVIPIPEPSTGVLLLTCVCILPALVRRRC